MNTTGNGLGIRPEILLHPNIPKPLHGLNPRSILGDEWWDKRSTIAYAEYDFRCWACGIRKEEADYHRWLEGHEAYKIDYAKGSAEMIEVTALCHSKFKGMREWANHYCNEEDVEQNQEYESEYHLIGGEQYGGFD